MICAWKELVSILPQRIRREVEAYSADALDIRLRLGAAPEIVTKQENVILAGTVRADDLNYVINSASRYSPWAAATISKGYLSGPGGHRIGICGEAVMKEGRMYGIRHPTSLCIRVARDLPGIAQSLKEKKGSILILGAPGWGKTTLLRDLIRQKSNSGIHISVVDERGELFPGEFDKGQCTEVLTGCPKPQGIDTLLRTMGPQIVAVDEITAAEDCQALRQAACCGVELLATAHAGGLDDYLHRNVYAPLVKDKLFDYIVVLHGDRSWHLERSKEWNTNGLVRC